MTAKIVEIASVCTARAKDVDGEWRDLEAGDLVATGEEILIEASGAQYQLAAYKLQRLDAGEYTDAVTVSLDTPSGSSHFRQDRVTIEGSELTNAVSLFTVDKGQLLLCEMLRHLKAQQWNRFSFPVGSGATPAPYKGLSDDLDHTSRPEYAGAEQEFTGLIMCDREQFGSIVPRSGQKLTWSNGKTYRIETVREDEISFALEVVSVNK